MRRDMLSDLQDEDGEDPILARKRELGLVGPGIGENVEEDKRGVAVEGVDWTNEVSGTKKVLAMDVSLSSIDEQVDSVACEQS